MYECLKSFMLLLTSAIPSGRLYYFDYDFDHKEKKLKGFQLADPTKITFMSNNPYFHSGSVDFFCRIISNSAHENCGNNHSMGLRCPWA